MMHDMSTLFISVIDFDNSLLFLPAFDVGYFISQWSYQFRNEPKIMARYGASSFVREYLAASNRPGTDAFLSEVNLFRIRGNVSVAAYLIKLGMGESEDMEAIIGQSLSLLNSGSALK